MTSYAAAVSGLTKAEARVAFEDLKREGQHVPAPTDAEVDQFLERQAFNVSQDDSLSPAKKETLMTRLRSAIGRRLNLDGATFHAWKNVIAEAVRRNRRRIAVGVTSIGLAFGMAACGDTPKTHTPPAPPAAVATVSPSASSATQASVAPIPESADAVAAFGQNNVQAGYEQVVKYTNDMTFQPELLKHKDAYTEADFAAPRAQMTQGMRNGWDSLVAKAIAGDKEGKNGVEIVSYYDLASDGYTLPASGPIVVNESISNPQVSVDKNSAGVQRLVFTFTQHAEVRFLKNGTTPVRYPYDKTATYHLVPAPAGSPTPWLIDGLTANYKAGTEMPDTTK